MTDLDNAGAADAPGAPDFAALFNTALDDANVTDADTAPPSERDLSSALDPAGEGTPPEPSRPVEGRDDKGRFVAKEPVKDAPPLDGAKTAIDPKTLTDKPLTAEERIAPPVNWKGDAKIAWERLGNDVKKALVEDYKRVQETEARLGPIAQVLEPRRASLVAQYGSEANAVQRLLQISDLAERDPTSFLTQFAQARGIDLTKLIPGAPGVAAPNTVAANPVDHPLAAEVQQLKAVVQQFVSTNQSAQSEHLTQSIQAFAADPAHPYFNDVRAGMAALIQSGQAKTLKEAYDQATWANPAIRNALLAQAREQEQEANRQRVERAKAAALTATGAPGPKGPGTGAIPQTFDEIFAEQLGA